MQNASSIFFISVLLFSVSLETIAQDKIPLKRHFFEIENPEEEKQLFTRIENRSESGETVIWIFDLQNRMVSQSKIGLNPEGEYNEEVTETYDTAGNLISKTIMNLDNSRYFTSFFEKGAIKGEVFYQGEQIYTIWRQNPEKGYSTDHDDFKPKTDAEVLNKFLAKKLTYPIAARRLGAQGTAIVAILISEEGKAKEIELANGVQIHKDLGKEALRAIKLFQGPYTPALNLEGKPTEAWLYIPVRFKIR